MLLFLLGCTILYPLLLSIRYYKQKNLIESMREKVVCPLTLRTSILLNQSLVNMKAILKENDNDSIFQATSTPWVVLAMAFTVS